MVISVFAGLSSGLAWGQAFPTKPIRMLVGFAPGGSTDVVARGIAQRMTESLGQNVIVENRPGAGGALATERVATSPADGYTIQMMSISDTVLPALRKLPYDIDRDLAPVSMTAILPIVLVVHPSVPARNVRELVQLARARPERLNYGSAGIGSGSHLPGELFNMMANVRVVHVPFKGGSESAIATVSGQVDMSYTSIAAGLPLVDAGKVRALGVTSLKRASAMPAVPTFDESGLPGYQRSGWNGLVAPAGTRPEVIGALNTAISRIVNAREMKDWLVKQGLEAQTGTPEEFWTFVRRELVQNAALVKQAGASAQ